MELSKLLDTLMEYGIAHARRVLIQEGYKQLTPICHLIDREGKGEIVAAIWQNDFEKQMAIAFLKKRAHDMDAKAVLFMAEAWFYPPGVTITEEQLRTGNYIRASQHPNRRECVIIEGTDGTHHQVKIYAMVRNRHTKKITDLIEEFTDVPAEKIKVQSAFLSDIIAHTTH